MPEYDVVVVGSGPNGLAAAIEMARHGLSVFVVEGHSEIGGGTRTSELTLSVFRHDVCSAVHPLAVKGSHIAQLPLDEHGLEWLFSPAPVTHPFDDGRVAVAYPDLEETVMSLGADGARYRRTFGPLVARAEEIHAEILRPLLHVPAHPSALARFASRGIRSAAALGARFRTMEARGLFAGMASHVTVGLSSRAWAGVGVSLTIAAHAWGFPIARGGSASIGQAMASLLRSLGGEIETGRWVTDLSELPSSQAVLSPRPHRTPIDHVYMCSASTAPGAGIHGMPGYHAAKTALAHTFGERTAG